MRTRRRHESSTEGQQRDRWLLSYADLVTLLLGLFIVLYAASDSKRAQQIAESFNSQQTGNGIFDGGTTAMSESETLRQQLIEDAGISRKANIRSSSDGLVVSLAESGFFAAGDAAIDPASIAAIDSLAAMLADGSFQIRIEGHTDSVPISTARYPSNWELSTARAANVLARLIDRGIAPERLSAAGFAGFRPVEDNSTSEGRALNRRVDIVILGR